MRAATLACAFPIHIGSTVRSPSPPPGSASTIFPDCRIRAAWVDVLRVFGKTDLDNTDVARDHSFHCTANAESRRTLTILHYECGVNGFNIPVTASLSFCPPAAVRVPKPGGRQAQFHPREKDPGRRGLVRQPARL